MAKVERLNVHVYKTTEGLIDMPNNSKPLGTVRFLLHEHASPPLDVRASITIISNSAAVPTRSSHAANGWSTAILQPVFEVCHQTILPH
jgi:hypothetical protein